MDCGEKLLAELWRLLDSDPFIDELGFLVAEQLAELHDLPGDVEVSFGGDPDSFGRDSCGGGAAGGNLATRTPSRFWLRDHKLAIAVDALGPVYKAAMAVFLALRKDLETNSSKVDESLIKVTRVLVIVNADHSTAWNMRKRVLSKSILSYSELVSELRLSGLVLTYAPKSEEAWAHRRWALKIIFRSFSAQNAGIIESENKLVDAIVERSLMNYRAWKHRCWLIPFMKFPQIETELRSRDSYRCTDNCVYHYRRTMLQRLIQQQHEFDLSWRRLATIWNDELNWIADLISNRSFGHEAMWIHRRFLAHGLLTHNDLFDQVNAVSFRNELSLVSFVLREFELAKAYASGDAQEYSSSYRLWLVFVFRKKHDSEEVEKLFQEEIGTDAASTLHKRSLSKYIATF